MRKCEMWPVKRGKIQGGPNGCLLTFVGIQLRVNEAYIVAELSTCCQQKIVHNHMAHYECHIKPRKNSFFYSFGES